MEEEEEEILNEEYIPDSKTDTIINLTKITGDDRITTNLLRKNEFVQVVMKRADQIDNGASTFNKRKAIDSVNIAIIEIIEKSCPLSVMRHITDDIVEIWNVNEMALTPNCLNDIDYFLKEEKPNLKKKIEELLDEKIFEKPKNK